MSIQVGVVERMYVGRVKEEGGRGELEEEDGYQQML